MKKGADNLLESISEPGQQRDAAEWRRICELVVVRGTPRLTIQYSSLTDLEWEKWISIHGNKAVPLTKDFHDSVFTILFQWSLEDHLNNVGDDSKSIEDKIKDFLLASNVYHPNVMQSWRKGQSGKTVVVNAACSPMLGATRLELNWSYLQAAGEAEVLRRINMNKTNDARAVKDTNTIPDLADLAILRLVHTKSRSTDINGAISIIETLKKNSGISSEKLANKLTQARVAETMKLWSECYRLRCAWGEKTKQIVKLD